MNKTFSKSVCSPVMAVLCCALLLSCSSHTQQEDETAITVDSISRVADKVADWQLDHLEDLSYIRFLKKNVFDRRGWHHGAFYVGLSSWAAIPANKQYYQDLIRLGRQNDWRLGGRKFHADDHVVGQMYLSAYEVAKDPEMIVDLRKRFDAILANPPAADLEFKGRSIRAIGGRSCQVRWCWADALFMAPPVWLQLSNVTGDRKYFDYADKEFWAAKKYLYDTQDKLFFRDSRYFSMREEAKKIFWSRGNGWVFAGIAKILQLMPQDHVSRPKYITLYKEMAARLAGLQQENGLWRASLLSEDIHLSPETSGSAFIVYGLAWGINEGILSGDTYQPAVEKGWRALVKAVDGSGKLGWVQPVGSAPDNILASDSHLYGVGAFLLAASELYYLSHR